LIGQTARFDDGKLAAVCLAAPSTVTSTASLPLPPPCRLARAPSPLAVDNPWTSTLAMCSLVHCVNANCVSRLPKQEEGWGQSTPTYVDSPSSFFLLNEPNAYHDLFLTFSVIILTMMNSGVGLVPTRLPALVSLYLRPMLPNPKTSIPENVEMNTVTAPS
jgi:hypothetical protein